MDTIHLINKKKQKLELTKKEINFLIKSYMNNETKDYQMSAFLMAVCLNGMTKNEIVNFTNAMINSGYVVDLSSVSKLTVDKHSTGGVGDKTSLVLTSILAPLDLAVAKMSGRGLGHTGGTIDKLESLEGFSVELTEEQFIKQINQHGQAIIGQSGNLVPADKRLYALRDVTATVDSIPLIAASIMSKKIASSAQTIILDVKYGAGAFMPTNELAEELANTLVMIGNEVGRKVIALLSSMEQPLGYAIGNVLEVEEAIAALNGEFPNDLKEVTYELAGELLIATDKASNKEEAFALIDEVIANGLAKKSFDDFIKAQGATDDAIEKMPIAKNKLVVTAEEAGFVKEIVANEIGRAAMLLGAGRQTKEDEIDLAVGIILHKKVGDKIEIDDEICEIHFNDDKNLDRALEIVANSYKIQDEKVNKKDVIAKIIK